MLFYDYSCHIFFSPANSRGELCVIHWYNLGRFSRSYVCSKDRSTNEYDIHSPREIFMHYLCSYVGFISISFLSLRAFMQCIKRMYMWRTRLWNTMESIVFHNLWSVQPWTLYYAHRSIFCIFPRLFRTQSI